MNMNDPLPPARADGKKGRKSTSFKRTTASPYKLSAYQRKRLGEDPGPSRKGKK